MQRDPFRFAITQYFGRRSHVFREWKYASYVRLGIYAGESLTHLHQRATR